MHSGTSCATPNTVDTNVCDFPRYSTSTARRNNHVIVSPSSSRSTNTTTTTASSSSSSSTSSHHENDPAWGKSRTRPNVDATAARSTAAGSKGATSPPSSAAPTTSISASASASTSTSTTASASSASASSCGTSAGGTPSVPVSIRGSNTGGSATTSADPEQQDDTEASDDILAAPSPQLSPPPLSPETQDDPPTPPSVPQQPSAPQPPQAQQTHAAHTGPAPPHCQQSPQHQSNQHGPSANQHGPQHPKAPHGPQPQQQQHNTASAQHTNQIVHAPPRHQRNQSSSNHPQQAVQSSSPPLSGPQSPTNEDGENDPDERRRQELITTIQSTEHEFEQVKSQFFTQELQSIDQEIDAIKAGTHPILTAQLMEMDEQAQERIYSTEQWHKYQIENINMQLQHEKMMAEQECNAEKIGIKERMLVKMTEKKRRLLDEKQQFVLTVSSTLERQVPPRVRSKRSTAYGSQLSASAASSAPRRKPPQLHVSYTLKESEIMEDLAIIRKAVQASGHGILGKGDVYVDKGSLHIRGKTYERGKSVIVENTKNRWQGVITTITTNDFCISSVTDGKQKFLLTDLRSGKYHLHDHDSS
ncbi:breast cancer metastasis-suppressor 1 [Pelomyxa schiedti]|nr:breast cancer metastasis-suppressor 1 [Pelomyxa schiedti]